MVEASPSEVVGKSQDQDDLSTIAKDESRVTQSMVE
jgi:hypothetical protein